MADENDSPEVTPPSDQPGEQSSMTPENGGDNNPESGTGSSDSLSLSDLADSHATVYAGFDPSIHATNEDGTPKRKANGDFALKRGRKAGSAAASALPPKNAAQRAVAGAPVSNSPARMTSDEAARHSANIVINATVYLVGEEIGKPENKEEAEGLKLSFKNYYDVRGVPDLPPELGLVLGIGAYIMPRLRHEKAQPKIERLVSWVRSKIGK